MQAFDASNMLIEDERDLTDDEVKDKTAEYLQRDDVASFTVTKNRHERRRDAKLERQRTKRERRTRRG